MFIAVSSSSLVSLICLILIAAPDAQAARTTFPELCDAGKTKEAIVASLKPEYGECMDVESNTSFFGHPESDFKQWTGAIFRCSKIGAIKFTAVNLVDAKKKTCVLSTVKQTRLPGSYCELTDQVDDNWKEIKNGSFSFYEKDKAAVAKLTNVQKNQILLTAQRDNKNLKTAWAAVQALREGSEGSDLYYEVFEVNGAIYNVVHSYPGGNSSAMIFADGSTKPVAINGDDSIACEFK
jgi:hypothetical protein